MIRHTNGGKRLASSLLSRSERVCIFVNYLHKLFGIRRSWILPLATHVWDCTVPDRDSCISMNFVFLRCVVTVVYIAFARVWQKITSSWVALNQILNEPLWFCKHNGQPFWEDLRSNLWCCFFSNASYSVWSSNCLQDSHVSSLWGSELKYSKQNNIDNKAEKTKLKYLEKTMIEFIWDDSSLKAFYRYYKNSTRILS